MARFASLRSALVLLAALLALTAIAPAGRVAAQEAATPEPATETAGGEDTFNALRAEILSRPIVYGPEDGSLTHDPERVTLASTGVDLRDFAVRIECVAPISAAEGFWDCGLFFRDVIGEEHFRFGIVSDQTWFLSIGSAAPLQAGSGIDVRTNAGESTTLELFAIGARGYFGINGQYVDSLDLSAIVRPGDISIATAFFSDTYIEGGVTEYEDFIIWSYDEPEETDTPTAIGPGETATPPAEPTGAAPTATASPALAEPSPAASATIDEAPVPVVVEPVAPPAGQPPAEPGIAGDTYTSPTFGYQFSWDPSWGVEIESSENNVDYLRITNGTTTADLLGYDAALTSAQCIQTNITFYESEPGYSNVSVVTDANGEAVMSVSPTSSTALLTFTYTDPDGLQTRFFDYLLCVPLPGRDAVVQLEQYVQPDRFAEQLPIMQELQRNVTVYLESAASPVAGSTPEAEVTPTPGQEPPRPPGIDPSTRATFVLEPINDSGVSGSGVIAVLGRQSALTAIVNGAPEGAYLAIVRGGCTPEAITSEPDYRIGRLDQNGIVSTEVRVRLSGLLNRDVYGVVVYPSQDDLSQQLACGVIESE